MTEDVMERGLTVAPQTPGVQALAALSEADFERNLKAIRQGQQRIARMQKELLIPGVDYGNVPGVDKPSLGKPGAEKLCSAYSLAARIEKFLTIGDGLMAPQLTYDATCHLHLGSFDGPEIGIGFGTCNSWETKYRYRNAERQCPTCGKSAIIAGRADYGGGWLCFKKRGGCGAKFGIGDPQITGQQAGREENPEPWDLANTLMKMAEKRSHVDATLRSLAASGIFTQDLEDNVVVEVTPAPETPAVARPAQRQSNEPPRISDAELAAMSGAMPARAPRPAPVAEEATFRDADATPEPSEALGANLTGCGVESPYEDAGHCGLPAGHLDQPRASQIHRELDGTGKVIASWPAAKP